MIPHASIDVEPGLSLGRRPLHRKRLGPKGETLLPSEETPTKSATLDDFRALERGCAGDQPLDLRDRAIVSDGARPRRRWGFHPRAGG